MNARPRGLAWLAERGFSTGADPVSVSKLYRPKESWTSARAWWFEFPESIVRGAGLRSIHLLCEAETATPGFYHLQVPTRFLEEHKVAVGYRAAEDKYSLFLSAESENRFQEVRGPGLIEFARFLVEH